MLVCRVVAFGTHLGRQGETDVVEDVLQVDVPRRTERGRELGAPVHAARQLRARHELDAGQRCDDEAKHACAVRRRELAMTARGRGGQPRDTFAWLIR